MKNILSRRRNNLQELIIEKSNKNYFVSVDHGLVSFAKNQIEARNKRWEKKSVAAETSKQA